MRIEAGVGVGEREAFVGGSAVAVGDGTRGMHATPRSVKVMITMKTPMIRFSSICSSQQGGGIVSSLWGFEFEGANRDATT